MKQKLLAGLLVALMILGGTGGMSRASVETVVPVEGSAAEIGPNSYWESWQVWSTRAVGQHFGPWMMGPRAAGPGTVTLSNAHTVSNFLSGTLRVIKWSVDAAVGFNTTRSWTQTASYSITVPAGQTWRIIYRSEFERWEVAQRLRIRMGGQIHWGRFEHLYANRWRAWDFDWRREN